MTSALPRTGSSASGGRTSAPSRRVTGFSDQRKGCVCGQGGAGQGRDARFLGKRACGCGHLRRRVGSRVRPEAVASCHRGRTPAPPGLATASLIVSALSRRTNRSCVVRCFADSWVAGKGKRPGADSSRIGLPQTARSERELAAGRAVRISGSWPAWDARSAQACLVEHCDQRRSAAVLFAELGHAFGKYGKLIRRRCGCSRPFEDPHRAGVRAPVDLVQDLVDSPEIHGQGVGRVLGLAGVGRARPAIRPGSRGSAAAACHASSLALVEQRVDERAGITATERGKRGVALDPATRRRSSAALRRV